MAGLSESSSVIRRTAITDTPTTTRHTTSVNTAPESVVPEDPTTEEPGHRRRHWLWLVPLGLLLVAGVAAAFITVPYYAISPGAAVDVGPLVTVDDGPRFPPEGDVLLTTVSLRPVTALEAVRGWLDPNTEVVPNGLIDSQDVGEEELRRINLQLMDNSKQAAQGVAFEELGFDAIQARGASVIAIVPGTPAEGSLATGDTIVAIEGEPVRFREDVVERLGRRSPGDRITLTVLSGKDDDEREETVVLGTNPDQPGEPFLGVGVETRVEFDFPYAVDIESERIGGPSAGLAFTLGLLDVLTEGELTGGGKVAATGTIELDGSVGPVGGVAQKAVAVDEAGAELFLVPASELEAARSLVGDDLRVEGVATLDDALRILAGLGGNGLALPQSGDDSA